MQRRISSPNRVTLRVSEPLNLAEHIVDRDALVFKLPHCGFGEIGENSVEATNEGPEGVG